MASTAIDSQIHGFLFSLPLAIRLLSGQTSWGVRLNAWKE